MNFLKIKIIVLISAVALSSGVAYAHSVKCDNLTIAHPYATPTIGSEIGRAHV